MNFSCDIDENGRLVIPYSQVKEFDKEFEIYKKALYMACNNQEYLVNDFLKKAREEE